MIQNDLTIGPDVMTTRYGLTTTDDNVVLS